MRKTGRPRRRRPAGDFGARNVTFVSERMTLFGGHNRRATNNFVQRRRRCYLIIVSGSIASTLLFATRSLTCTLTTNFSGIKPEILSVMLISTFLIGTPESKHRLNYAFLIDDDLILQEKLNINIELGFVGSVLLGAREARGSDINVKGIAYFECRAFPLVQVIKLRLIIRREYRVQKNKGCTFAWTFASDTRR